MKQILNITDTEWKVMKVLWFNSPCTAIQIHEALKTSTTWKPNTVRTLLSRLVAKGVANYKEDGKTYLYSPVLTEEECIKAEGKSFLQKVYNGALNVMLANFIDDDSISEKDIKELKQILDRKNSKEEK